jgi:hypothetical protein
MNAIELRLMLIGVSRTLVRYVSYCGAFFKRIVVWAVPTYDAVRQNSPGVGEVVGGRAKPGHDTWVGR